MTNTLAAGRDTHYRHNLPSEVASFIGRERELAAIARLLPTTRLLTLTGPGGVGKTRLALRVAAGLPQSYPDGIWLVQLAPISDSALVPRVVAAALGVRGTAGRSLLATLAAALASLRLLLVLDNCEHLIGACARLAETLLRACPHLCILATSREPLRIPGEVTWRVPPLALPAPGTSLEPESLARIESVALFIDRARARRADFTFTAHTAPSVAAICRHLEGLPLGIELAAAQVGALVPAQIAARLDDAPRLLGGGSRTEPRQETLRAALDWSYALLGGAEQSLLRRLSVFSGGFDLPAAERVCAEAEDIRDSEEQRAGGSETGADRGGEREVGRGGMVVADADVLALLTALVEKSLLESRPHASQARYRLLEPVRQYAWARLNEHEESEAMRRRHALYYVGLAEAAEPVLMSGARGAWLGQLAMEQDNLRTALSWSRHATVASDNEVGVRLAGALCWYWTLRGEVSEGQEWVEAALAAGRQAAPAVRARALYAAAELGWLAGHSAMARARAEESAALFRALGDRRGLAYTLQSLPMAVDHPGAREAVEESLRLFAEVGDAWGAALALSTPDLFKVVSDGDPTGEARARLEEALARWRALGDDWGAAQVLNMLGDLARSQGDVAGATARYEESLTLLRRQGLTGSAPSVLHNLAYLGLRRGETRRALALFRESLALFRDLGDQRGIADCLAGLAAVLGALKQPERAARFLGAAEALRTAIGATVWPANASDYERGLVVARQQLGEPVFSQAWAAGRALPVEQAMAEAFATAPLNLPPGAENSGMALTARERDVAALVARGLTNRQIGATLFITEGTARLHVKHILSKLSFTSRAQVAAWAVARGLGAAPDAQ